MNSIATNIELFKKELMALVVYDIFVHAECVMCHGQHDQLRGYDFEKSVKEWKDNHQKTFSLCRVGAEWKTWGVVDHKFPSYWRQKHANQLHDQGLILFTKRRNRTQLVKFSIYEGTYEKIFNKCFSFVTDHDYMAGIKNGAGSYTTQQLITSPEAIAFMNQLANEVQL